MSQVLTVDAILFGILVFSGILGNFLVISVVYQTARESGSRYLPPSGAILVNLCTANLLTTFFRTVPIFVSDLGLDVRLEVGWCRLLMLLWVWWRAVGCWSTLALSAFHCMTVKRQQVQMGSLVQQRERRRVWATLALVWGVNLAMSMPAVVFASRAHDNGTVEVMVISCTTRPLLGCTWEFPSISQGIAFASASLAINELTPLVLMVSTNMATLHTLTKHIRSVTASGDHTELDRHVSAERKASHVIMALVALFVVCWVLQVAAVTYYNHNRGQHVEALLTLSHFSSSLFVGFSPMVVALGHGRLRAKIHSLFLVRFRAEKARGMEAEAKVSDICESKK